MWKAQNERDYRQLSCLWTRMRSVSCQIKPSSWRQPQVWFVPAFIHSLSLVSWLWNSPPSYYRQHTPTLAIKHESCAVSGKLHSEAPGLITLVWFMTCQLISIILCCTMTDSFQLKFPAWSSFLKPGGNKWRGHFSPFSSAFPNCMIHSFTTCAVSDGGSCSREPEDSFTWRKAFLNL